MINATSRHSLDVIHFVILGSFQQACPMLFLETIGLPFDVNAMWFDDDDVDIGPVVKETRFASWNAAWEDMKPTPWYQQVIYIHPDYQRFYREHFNEIEAAVPEERYTTWIEWYYDNWIKALHGETTS